jgi:hypothetical protein
MTNNSEKENAKQEQKAEKHSWWHLAKLIAGIQATPTEKYFLTLVAGHTNTRKGFAWASQETLAQEMCVDLRTVGRVFAWAKKLGVIGVRRVRTGKLPSEQHNEYQLAIERLEQLQPKKSSEHQTLMSGDTHTEHQTPVSCVTPDISDTNTGQIPQGTPDKSCTEHQTPVSYKVLSTSGIEDSGGGSSSSQNRKPKKPDDDDPPLSQNSKKKIHPDLRRFAKARISQRIEDHVDRIDNREAYMHTALKTFMEQIEEETEIYLIELAEKYFESHTTDGNGRIKDVGDIFRHLRDNALKHHLPFTEETGWRIIRGTAEDLGWKVIPPAQRVN